MADGMFTTGRELQKQRLQELTANNVELAQQAASTPREAQNRGLGAAIGSALVGKLMQGDAPVMAGDVLATYVADTGKRPETAADFAELQKMMFAEGLEEDGLGLTPKIKGLQEMEKGFGKGEGAGGSKLEVAKVTNDDRQFVRASVLERSGREDSLIGSELAPMLGEDASDIQKAMGYKVVNGIAEQANRLDAQLRKEGVDDYTRGRLVETFLDSIENDEDIIKPSTEWGFFFGEEAEVNNKAFVEKMDAKRMEVFNMVTKDGMPEPRQAAPHQQTTQAPEMGQPGATGQDVQGRVADAGRGSPEGQKLANDPAVQKQVDALDAQIKRQSGTLEQMKAAKASDKALKEVEAAIEALRNARDRFTQ